MRKNLNVIAAYIIMLGLIILVGIFQSWNVALSIFNMCLISAVMTMGANIQWGYAGLINFGLMGYAALGGLAAVLISVDPVQEAWSVGGFNLIMCLWLIIAMVFGTSAWKDRILQTAMQSKRMLIFPVFKRSGIDWKSSLQCEFVMTCVNTFPSPARASYTTVR